MKQFAFIAVFLCAWSVAAQTPPRESKPCPTDTIYDRRKDMSQVFCGPFNPDPVTPEHRFDVTLLVEHRGTSFKFPAKFIITLVWFDEGENSKPIHKSARKLYLQTDTTRLELPIKPDTEPGDSMDGLAIEIATVEVNAVTLRALLMADSVAGRWGSTEFKFSASGLKSYKDFVRPLLASVPAGPPPAPAGRQPKPKPRPL